MTLSTAQAVAPPGHIKIARKAFDADAGDKFWLEPREFSKWEAWLDMIQLAQWTARKFTTTKFGTVLLGRGEFVLSIRQMAKRWGWSIQSVRTFVKSPEISTRLTTQRETQAGTVYLIVNYDKYQSTPEPATQPATQEPTHLQHTSNTPVTQEQAGKAVTTRTTLSNSPEFERVSKHYLARYPRRRIGPKDRTAVAKALTWGYSAAELCDAIDGNAVDEWHMKEHKHELYYVLRDTGLIDRFRDKAASAARPLVDPVSGVLTLDGMAAVGGGR